MQLWKKFKDLMITGKLTIDKNATAGFKNTSGNIIPLAWHENGSNTDTTTAMTLNLDFAPTYVRIVNGTGLTRHEWFSGMADSSSQKTDSLGVPSLVTTGGFIVSGNTVTCPAKAASDAIRWVAFN